MLFCLHQLIRFPPAPFVEVPCCGQSNAAVSGSSPSYSADASSCSVNIRYYSFSRVVGDVAIQLRCFAMNGDKSEELCALPTPHIVLPLSASAPPMMFCEWLDVRVPCRCILEVSFSYGPFRDSHLVYVGQAPKLYVMAKVESELIRCLTDVQHDDWFRSCGPNLSGAPASDIRIVLPQQFPSDRFSKVMLFDLKEEDWKVGLENPVPVFRKLQTPQACEFNGKLTPGNYRLYLWDGVHQRWIMDGCTIKVPENTPPNGAVLFGHRQDTDKESSFGQYRVMDLKASLLSVAALLRSCIFCRSLSFFC